MAPVIFLKSGRGIEIETRELSSGPGADPVLLQVRTWVPGLSFLKAQRELGLPFDTFAQDVASAMAHLHTCPLEGFGKGVRLDLRDALQKASLPA